MAKLNIGN